MSYKYLYLWILDQSILRYPAHNLDIWLFVSKFNYMRFIIGSILNRKDKAISYSLRSILKVVLNSLIVRYCKGTKSNINKIIEFINIILKFFTQYFFILIFLCIRFNHWVHIFNISRSWNIT